MNIVAWLVTGGFAKGYRTQLLGLITALSAVVSWAVGDATLAELVTKAPVIFGGLGLAALGIKVNDAAAQTPPAKSAKAK
jgi:drug/metabolite transporter (DMT)-like permease